jgi:pimeloyl-ACP methyl ester carboxylesterase
MKSGFVRLTHKPNARISYSFVSGSESYHEKTLIVFVNGLMLPKAGWLPTIEQFLSKQMDKGIPYPAMLLYDRYGQGSTVDTDPMDEGKEPGFGHDTSDVVNDLHQLIIQIALVELGIPEYEAAKDLRLILVSNSIGAAISRLYAQRFPNTVVGLLMLDSIMANTDFVSIIPDPDSPGFSEGDLPEGVTPEACRKARAIIRAIFHPSIRNKEGLNRKTLAELLPRPDGPQLEGSPLVSVVGHDPKVFVESNAEVCDIL